MATLVDYAALADAASPRHLQGMCDLDPYLVRREKIAVLKAQAGELPDADLMLAATHELIKLFSSQRRPISAEIREIHITTQKLH